MKQETGGIRDGAAGPLDGPPDNVYGGNQAERFLAKTILHHFFEQIMDGCVDDLGYSKNNINVRDTWNTRSQHIMQHEMRLKWCTGANLDNFSNTQNAAPIFNAVGNFAADVFYGALELLLFVFIHVIPQFLKRKHAFVCKRCVNIWKTVT